jgi:hypothetical protein
MKRTPRCQIAVSRVAYATLAAVGLLALLLTVVAVIPAPAAAATVSGTVKGGAGYRLLLVQANGTAKKVTIRARSGAFSIPGVKLGNASLQLVKADGSYYGPVVLRATATGAFIFIKGAANLKLGTAKLKGGYALVATAPTGRYQTLAAYKAKAVRGKPIGAGRLGLVRTAQPRGLNGAGGDLDRDGIINAFDIDDNGNLIIDNVDRTGRGAGRPRAGASGAAAAAPRLTQPHADAPGPPPLYTTGTFFIFSNYWLTGAQQVNANIPGITDLDGLIARNLPSALSLATVFPSGESALLDGLGNSYISAHTLDGVTYPRVNDAPPTYSADGLLNLTNSTQHPGGAIMMPGALPSEISSGDCFTETAANGTKYPGTVNFVFNTAPALKSYQFDTEATATDAVYDANGVWDGQPGPNAQITVPKGASKVTLTFWRPQRKAAPGEPASAGGWVDIGGLWYSVDLSPVYTSTNPDDPGSGPSDLTDAYSNATANGAPIPPSPWAGGMLDPVGDLPADPDNTISFTLDLAKCFSSWPTLGPGAWFRMGLQAKGGYGDNAMIGLLFTLE